MKRLYLFLENAYFCNTTTFWYNTCKFFIPTAYPRRSYSINGRPIRDTLRFRKLKSRVGMDKSLFEQFIIYISNVLRGDLGNSATTRPVAGIYCKDFRLH